MHHGDAMIARPKGVTNAGRQHARKWGALIAMGLGAGLLASCIAIPGRGEKQIRYELTHRFGVEDPQFLRSMGQLLGPAIVPGNRITALQNGDEIFPAMLGAIHSARESIT